MKYLLILFLWIPPLFIEAKAKNEFDKYGYQAKTLQYEGHQWIIVRAKHTNSFQLVHHPDCIRCNSVFFEMVNVD